MLLLRPLLLRLCRLLLLFLLLCLRWLLLLFQLLCLYWLLCLRSLAGLAGPGPFLFTGPGFLENID